MPPAPAIPSPLAAPLAPLAALTGPRARLVVIGNSHVFAVARAARPEDRLLMENFGPPGPPTPGVLKRHPRSWRWRLERYRPDALALSLDGNDHNILGLLNHPEPWHLAAEPEGAPGRLVPAAMMRAAIAARTARHEALAARIVRRLAPRRVMVLAPPPPHARVFAPGLAAQFHDHAGLGVAPDERRLALHRLEMDRHREVARALGATFVPPPTLALDAKGMLRQFYAATDAVHCNEAYGRLVLDALNALLAEPPVGDAA